MTEIRVGFVFYQGTWLGGINYLRNLFTAIQSLPEKTIQPVLFAGRKADVDEFDGLAEIIRTPILDRNTPLWWVSKFFAKVLTRRDYLLYWLLRKHRIDLLSHFGRFWRGCSIPAIGWIPDFQHVHLPDFFTDKECEALDRLFFDIIRKSDAVIVSSQNGLNDFEKFSGGETTPAHILRFVSCLYPTPDELPSRAELSSRYNLDRPWFHIPNQFWAHKNHTVVLEALRSFKLQENCPLIVCTGSNDDYRNPDYFPSVMKKVRDFGLQDEFRVLGIVPYADVVSLMREAVAVINPSLYEGWSTSVEEAKAMGKKVLLSNIAVHREQNPQRGHYFKADDSSELNKLFAVAMQEYNEIKEKAYQAKARQDQIDNRKLFAKQYATIVNQVIELR